MLNLFNNGDQLSCVDEANIDGLIEGQVAVDIADVVMMVQYMFFDGSAPANCP